MSFRLYESRLLSICRNVSKVHDEWFADEEKVRRTVGLLEKPVIDCRNVKEVSNPHLGY